MLACQFHTLRFWGRNYLDIWHPPRIGPDWSDSRLASGAHFGTKASEEGRTIVWVEQSGFSLLPLAVRTWAPHRATPVLRVPLTHDHLATMGGITPEGRLFLQTPDPVDRSPDVVRFLRVLLPRPAAASCCRVLLRKIAGKLLVIWDGAPIHRGQPSKDFLARGAAKRLHLEQLPGYAPDLHPAEGLWKYRNRVELGNACGPALSAVGLALRRGKERLRHKRCVLRACIRACGYSV
jgi:transposase